MSWLWLAIPLAPLLAIAAALRWPQRAGAWLWLCSLPALLAAVHPPEALALAKLWPGAVWGGDDLVGRAFLGLTALLWGWAGLFAHGSLAAERRGRFWLFWLLALCGNLLLVIAADGVSFYVGFTLMSLAAYGLVIHRGGPGPRRAGRVYLQLAVVGEMLLFAGLVSRIHECGGLTALDAWQSRPVAPLTALLLLAGFGIKAGFWPLHVWLPLAHPAAPAAASAVLSGAMIKAGILGLWRYLPGADPLLAEWAGALFAVGMFSAFYGVALGLAQSRTKVALAYSSISQMGYLLAIVALAWHEPQARHLWGTALAAYAVHHGFAKGALFMGAGMSSSFRLAPWQLLCLALPALSLAGLPLTTGLGAKVLFKDGLGQSAFSGLEWLLVLGSFASALLMLRVLWLVVDTTRRESQAPPPAVWLPVVLLCLMPLPLAWGWPLLREPVVESLKMAKLWEMVWPLLAGGSVAFLAARFRRRLPAMAIKVPNPALVLSLRWQRLQQRPPIPLAEPALSQRRWRRLERAWGRLLQRSPVALASCLLGLVLLLGWLWG